jgi:predicted aldo/keto reductase-like oxidoreductase
LKAVENGVNYFDTAYVYPNSEERLGAILLKNNLRDKVYIATKLPVVTTRKAEDFDRFFQAQLERLKTDHIDYYLLHMLPDVARWNKLCAWGIKEWIQEKKETGAIRQIGFSYHGSQYDFLELLDAYVWELCHIQYNYSDENNQAGVIVLKSAAKKNLPVIIMEPLLGGKLANGLPKKAVEAFQSHDPKLTPAAWAFRWLYNQPEVTVALSGMNGEAQLDDNLLTAAEAEPYMLDEDHMSVFNEVKEAFNATQRVPCTGCSYCVPCPQNVNIPACFSAYNTSYSIGFGAGLQLYLMGTSLLSSRTGSASRCVGCGKCEGHCPQSIEIRKDLKAVEKRLEPFWFNGVIMIARKFMVGN